MPSATQKRSYVHNQYQEEPARGVTSAEEGGASAMHSITATKKTVRIYKNLGGEWQVNLHDGSSPSVLVNQDVYEPQFRVHAFSVQDTTSTGVKVMFDEPDSEGVIERAIFGVDRAFHVTRVYLSNAETTATDINLHG